MDIAFLALTDLVAALRAKELSPADAVKAAYARLNAHEGKLNAFCHVLEEDEAVRLAQESEDRWTRGAPLGPLDGVAISDSWQAISQPSRKMCSCSSAYSASLV